MLPFSQWMEMPVPAPVVAVLSLASTAEVEARAVKRFPQASVIVLWPALALVCTKVL